MITLVMRTRNRIEYTMRALDALARQKDAPPFEVLIVDNASTDGTREAIHWISENKTASQWFPPIRMVFNSENLGDFGGMKVAEEYLRPECRFVGQVDNDILVPPMGLAVLHEALIAGGRVAMLRRRGVRREIMAIREKVWRIRRGSEAYDCLEVQHAVAFWLTSRDDFESHVRTSANCRQLTEAIGTVLKVMNLECVHIDGHDEDGPGSYVQAQKYPRSEIVNG